MKIRSLLTAALCLLLCPVMCASCTSDPGEGSETEVVTEAPEPHAIDDPIYYVAPNGRDTNPGTAAAPFATIEGARDALRARGEDAPEIPITVKIAAGTYPITSCITFDAQDSGTEEAPITYEAEGEVLFNGGVALNASDLVPLDETEKARLHGDAVEKVRKLDLTAYGLSVEDWGHLSAIGTYNTAYKYDNAVLSPLWCEVFINDERQTLARYPDSGYLTTTSPIKEGDCLLPLTKEQTLTDETWNALRNPEGDINGIDPETAARAASWATLDHVWMFGYPRFDWADMSSPVTAIDTTNNSMTTEFVSIYGLKESASYYFYNVFEELDSPGEWYLNRDTGMLYVYTDADLATAEIMLSLHSDSILRVTDAKYMTFRGITFSGIRGGDALNLSGEYLRLENCTVKNVAANAICIRGNNNYVGGCEIAHVGCGGVILDGGDRATLTPANTIVENNYIHHFGELTRTYCPALSVPGCGHIIRNNVIHDAPHMAIGFGGNDNLFEYNEIYRVCLEADDAGAIYGGKDFSAQGNIFRYNYFHDIYSIADTAAGVFAIYCDDDMGGCTIEHNIFERCNGAAMYHGGHNMIFRENLIIDKVESSTCFVRLHSYVDVDDLKPGGVHEANLAKVPYTSEIWTERFPQIQEYLTWTYREQAYPHYCDISNNIVINHLPVETNFTWEKEERQNRMDNNLFLDTTPESDLKKLCEEVAPTLITDFDAIPFSQIGIQNK